MANYTVVKPVTVKGNRYPVGMVLPESVFYPGGAARLARMGYVVKANETTGQMNTCLSVLPDETDVDGLGKIALELGSFQLTGTTFSGTAHYVTGYTGFHSDPSEQEGYFLPFGFGMPDGKRGQRGFSRTYRPERNLFRQDGRGCQEENVGDYPEPG